MAFFASQVSIFFDGIVKFSLYLAWFKMGIKVVLKTSPFIYAPVLNIGVGLIDFFLNMFSNNFMPHGHCYLWRPSILWMHVISNILIGIAYMAITLSLGVIWLKFGVPSIYRKLVFTFSLFIFMCGLTHFIEVLTTWLPYYRFEGFVKLLTAIVSVASAILLIPLTPNILGFLRREESEKAK